MGVLTKVGLLESKLIVMPDDQTLRRAQRNAVYELVERHGMNPDEFSWEQEFSTDGEISVLRHRDTDFYVSFGLEETTISPGPQFKEEVFDDATWEAKLESANTWLTELKIELDTPDLWSIVGKERSLANVISSERLDNDPLSPAERQLVSESLNEIKASLLSMKQFDQRQAAIVDNQFKYLAEAVNRTGKKDWLNLTFSTLVTVVVALALTQTQGEALLRLAASLLHSIWNGVPLLGR